MPQNRPYFNYSFKQLEEEFDNNQNNQEVLEKIVQNIKEQKKKTLKPIKPQNLLRMMPLNKFLRSLN